VRSRPIRTCRGWLESPYIRRLQDAAWGLFAAHELAFRLGSRRGRVRQPAPQRSSRKPRPRTNPGKNRAAQIQLRRRSFRYGSVSGP
jgi:hypothetical protein